MIEVEITSNGGKLELGRIRIERVETHEDGTADYSVQFAADRFGSVALHQRVVYGFPREKYNALALVLQALNTLQPEELELEEASASDLAREKRGTLPALPGQEAGSVHHHRSPFWRR